MGRRSPYAVKMVWELISGQQSNEGFNQFADMIAVSNSLWNPIVLLYVNDRMRSVVIDHYCRCGRSGEPTTIVQPITGGGGGGVAMGTDTSSIAPQAMGRGGVPVSARRIEVSGQQTVTAAIAPPN